MKRLLTTYENKTIYLKKNLRFPTTSITTYQVQGFNLSPSDDGKDTPNEAAKIAKHFGPPPQRTKKSFYPSENPPPTVRHSSDRSREISFQQPEQKIFRSSLPAQISESVQ
jgi:hypothetical protein